MHAGQWRTSASRTTGAATRSSRPCSRACSSTPTPGSTAPTAPAGRSRRAAPGTSSSTSTTTPIRSRAGSRRCTPTTARPARTSSRASSPASTARRRSAPSARDGSTRWLLERWRCRPGTDGTVIVDGVVTDVSALRNAEVALAESRSLLAAVVSAVDAYVYCWDYDLDGRGTPVYESVPAHLFLRTRPTVDPAEPWRTTLVPEDRDGARRAVERREAGLDGVMEWRCRGEDGEVRWLRDSWRCGSFRDGRRRIYGIVVDVSETVTAREDAAETRAHLDAVVDAIDDYVYAWAYEPGGEVAVSFESVAQARFLGVEDPGDDAVDLWRARVHPDDLEAFDDLIDRQRRCQDAAAEYRLSIPGSGWRWVYDRSHARRVPDGRVLAEGIVSDVTRLREAQERLREHDALFRTLADALPMSMWTEDAEGRVDFVNAQAEALWCLPRDDFTTPAWRERVHPDDRGRLAETTRGQGDFEVEFRIVLPDGSTRDVTSRRRVVRRPNGDVIGFVGTDVDVTAERAAAADLHAHVRRLDHANTELEAARLEADVRSRTDALTGLANRRHFTEELVAELRRAAHAGGPPAVLLLDIDRFKAVNDTYGHAVGDVVLAGVAERIEGALRTGSVAARWGGEEFAVLVRDVADDAALRGVGERIRRAVGDAPHPDARRRAAPVGLGRRRALDRRRAGRRRARGRGRPRALRRQAPRPRPDAPRDRPHRRGPAGRGAGGGAHRAGARARHVRARGHAGAALRAGLRALRRDRPRAGAAAGDGLPLPPRRPAARRRQGRHPRPHPGQARPARRRRVARDGQPRRDRRAARLPAVRPARGRGRGAPPPRALGRRRLSRRAGRGGHPARGADRRGRRRVLGDHLRPRLPARPGAVGGAEGAAPHGGRTSRRRDGRGAGPGPAGRRPRGAGADAGAAAAARSRSRSAGTARDERPRSSTTLRAEPRGSRL